MVFVKNYFWIYQLFKILFFCVINLFRAAGCIIYELIELKKAFPGENMVQIQEKIKTIKPQLNLERYDNRNNKNLYVQVNGCLIK